jgi:HipA-like kinase
MPTVPPRTVRVCRYVTPLREGGSLPAIVEADDDGLYVLKFRGAGQGPRVLIAELVCGELARLAGLPVPEIVFAELDPELARTEPDPEIHALILDSAGLNLALDYLPGSVTYDPVVQRLDADLASRIVWFDAFVSNVDRTAKNTNMLLWHRKLWLIDHGASLYFHHASDWDAGLAPADDPFRHITKHALLRYADRLREVDNGMAVSLTREAIETIVSWIPETWFKGPAGATAPGVIRTVTERRADYVNYFTARLAARNAFIEEAIRVR